MLYVFTPSLSGDSDVDGDGKAEGDDDGETLGSSGPSVAQPHQNRIEKNKSENMKMKKR